MLAGQWAFILSARLLERGSTPGQTNLMLLFSYFNALCLKKMLVESKNQCSGSMTFGVDPDPRIQASDKWIRILLSSLTFKMPTKTNLKKSFPAYCLLLFGGSFTSFFKNKKPKRSHKTVEIKVFFLLFLLAD